MVLSRGRSSSFSLGAVAGIALGGCLVLGCAQQADLARVQQDLENQMTKLDLKEKELSELLAQANEKIVGQNTRLEQKSSSKDLSHARVKISKRLNILEDSELPTMRGDIEELDHRLNVRLDTLQTQVTQQGKDIKAGQANVTAFLQQANNDNQAFTKKMENFRAALSTFKGSLAMLGDKLVQENERATTVEAEFGTKLDQHNEALTTASTTLQTHLEETVALLRQGTEASVKELQTDIKNVNDVTDALNTRLAQEVRRLNQQTKTNDANLQKVTQSLASSKKANGKAVTLLGGKVEGQAKQANQIKTQLAALTTRLSQQGEINTANLNKVTQSLTKGQEVLSKSNAFLEGKVDEQVTRVAQLKTDMAQLDTQIARLTDKLSTDTKTLKTYLEKDVKTSLLSITNQFQKRQGLLVDQMKNIEADVQALDTELHSDSAQLGKLAQMTVQLREAQAVMGNLLGERGDKILQQAGQLGERLNRLESSQAELTQQVDAKTQQTATHLSDVHTSVASIGEAFKKTSQTLAARIDRQEKHLNDVASKLRSLQPMREKVKAQTVQTQEAVQSVGNLRNTLQQVLTRLQDLETNQSALDGNVNSNTQTTTTHLAEIQSGLTTMKSVLDEANHTLSSRIDEQERQMNEIVTRTQAIQTLADASRDKVIHLNQLTETVNQLRGVVNTIGTKLGTRVDEHEKRLAQLVERLNLLSNQKR